MLPLIRDLYAHQAWADAEMFRFVGATPAAQSDKKVIELLNHIHTVQRFFFSAVRGDVLTREDLTRELPLPELHESYRSYHTLADSYLPKVRESHLRDKIVVPWFPNFQPSCQDALIQAVTHSIHHRAQVATLLRQLGGEPKPTDYIIWTSKDRPAPQWDAAAST
jgi:uncharacterized damage-inducible protein DinB